MKKLIYACFIALLALSFGCEKEELYFHDNSESLIENEQSDQFSSGEFHSKSNSASYENRSSSTSDDGFYDENGNRIAYLYLDMDAIEANYSGFYSGSFSTHYYNEMSMHFTIYNVENANSICGNIERWTVSYAEYNMYLTSIGGTHVGTILEGSSDDGENNSSTSSTSGQPGWGDENGNVSPRPPRPNDPNAPEQSIPVPAEYTGCF